MGEQDLTLSREVKLGLQSWSIQYNYAKSEEKPASIASLFNKSNRRITCIVWFVWFVNNLCYYGIVFLIPTTLQRLKGDTHPEKHQNLLDITISSLTEIPTPIICAFLVETKFFGRKNLLTIAFMLGGISLGVLVILDGTYFVILVSISKFFLLMTFTVSY